MRGGWQNNKDWSFREQFGKKVFAVYSSALKKKPKIRRFKTLLFSWERFFFSSSIIDLYTLTSQTSNNALRT